MVERDFGIPGKALMANPDECSQANANETPAGQYSFPTFCALVGDFNGDGQLDLATYPPGDTTLSGVVVILGNGDGTFQEPYAYGANGSNRDY